MNQNRIHTISNTFALQFEQDRLVLLLRLT